MYIITKVPTVIPKRFAKITAITSIPSIAPPKRMAKPLPIPEIIPPNSAQRSKSVSANGEAILTSIGKTSAISYANKEYIKTVYIA